MFIEQRVVVIQWSKSEFRYPIDGIKAIGEMTNEWGPFADDYFLCLVTKDDGRWSEVPMTAVTNDVRRELEQILGASLGFRLCNSTTFASNVVWPLHLAGTRMFEFNAPAPRTAFSRLLRRIGIAPSTNVQTLSPALLAAIRGQ